MHKKISKFSPTFLSNFMPYSAWSTLFVFVVTLVSYVRTLLPGVVGGDAGELQYAGPLLALVHPTGQPLYVALGFFWSHLVSIGTVAFRMNLLAAVCAAAACALLTWMINQIYGTPLVALAGGLTLGLGATFWGQAVLADKYALSAFFAVLVTGLALHWDATRLHVNSDRRLYFLSFAFGVSLLHHRSIFLFAPGLGLMILMREHVALWRNWRRTAICLILLLVPSLIVYPLFLPWVQSRHLSPLLWQPTTVPDWVDWWLERHVISDEVLNFGASASFAGRIGIYWQTMLLDYTPLVVFTAALGFVVLARRSVTGLAFLFSTFILVGGLAANFRGNERQFTYYLPSFVILIYAYAEGLNAIWHAVRSQFRPWSRRLAVAGSIGLAIVLCVPALQFYQTYPLRRIEAVVGNPLDIWRQTLKTGNMGERLAAGMNDLPPNAIVIGDWEQLSVLWYTQHIEHRRPDLTLLYPIDRLADYASSTKEVVLARHLPVGTEWHPTNIGALVHLQRQPGYAASERLIPVGTALYTENDQPRLELVGYVTDGDVYAAGRYVPLLLSWRALVDIPEDYSLSLHILDENWQQIWSQDISAPVLGMYPTSRWVKDEMVQDYHELTIPREMPLGRYLWTILVYRQSTEGGFVQLRDAQGNVEIFGGGFQVTSR